MSPAHDSAILMDDAATELIEAAERKRRAARPPQRGAGRLRAGAREDDQPRSATAVADEDEQDEPAGSEPHDDGESEGEGEGRPPLRRRPRRKVMRAPVKAGVFPPVVGEDGGEEPGTVTRGVHAGLNSLDWTRSRAQVLGLWGIIASAVLITVVVLSFYAGSQAPEPMPVTGLKITFLPGPRLPEQEIYAWVRRFPNADKLPTGAPWVLDRLADYLRHQAVVAEVRQVSVVHQPVDAKGERLRRVIELVIGLRQPVLPVVLASGERGWVDAEGWLLPGSLPGPTARRPTLRAVEWGGLAGVRGALALWKQLEPLIEPGLITDIHLYDALDGGGSQRGIVLYTRQGSRLIWGRPGDERFGVKNDDKIRDLVRAIRCQGDLNRVAAINVRFHQPFLVLRDAQPQSAPSQRDAQP
jgi:hypothetical protein